MDANVSVDVGKNVMELLEKLAVQIGTTADKVFPWYVKQQVIEGWMWLGISGGAIVISSIIAYCSLKKAEWKGGFNVFAYISIASCLSFLLATVFLVFGVMAAVTQIVNPEYYALKSLTSDMSKFLGR